MGGIIFIVIGILTVLFGIITRFKDIQTLNWKETIAEITELKLIEDFFGDSDGGTKYYCQVKYSYVVNGNSFEGNKINNSEMLNGNDENIEAYEKLKNAKKIIVYHNPYKNNQSCIVKGKTPLSFGLILFGTMIFLFGVFITYSSYEHENTYNEEIMFVK